MMAKKNDDEKKKKGGGLTLLLMLVGVLILVPSLLLGGFYFLHEPFKDQVNTVLSGAPEPIGSFFSKFPTAEDKIANINKISEYLLEMDSNIAVDKLLLIKTDDSKNYDDIIYAMTRLSPNKTKEILEIVREKTLQKDVLMSTLESIDEESNTTYIDTALLIEKMSLVDAVDEIKNMLVTGLDPVIQTAYTIENMNSVTSAKILRYIDEETRNSIFVQLSVEKRKEIEDNIASIQKNELGLMNEALSLKSKDLNELRNILTTEDNYKVEDLSIIFSTIGPEFSSKILMNTTDNEFLTKLYDQIDEYNILNEIPGNFLKDLNESIKLFSEFDDNVNELVNTFNKMDVQTVVDILGNLLKDTSSKDEYVLESGEALVLTNEDIVLEALRRTNEKKRGELLSSFELNTSSYLSRKLALPGKIL
jgi:hypothetical protein